MLLVIVGILVAVDLLILMIGTAAPQSRLVATSYVEQELRKNVSFYFLCRYSGTEKCLEFPVSKTNLNGLHKVSEVFRASQVK